MSSTTAGSARRLATLALLLLSAALIAVELFRPEDPDSWRTFAHEAQDSELEQLPNDIGPRRSVERWRHYLRALREGDAEAFALATRLWPVLRMAAHSSEEFFGALGWNLERRPARVFELVKPWGVRPVVTCAMFPHEATNEEILESIARRRVALNELLDGGYSDMAKECLEALRD